MKNKCHPHCLFFFKKSHWQYCLCVCLLYTCATANNANDAHPFCFTESQIEHCNLTVASLSAPNSSFRGELNAPLSQRVTVLHPSLCFFFFPATVLNDYINSIVYRSYRGTGNTFAFLRLSWQQNVWLLFIYLFFFTERKQQVMQCELKAASIKRSSHAP